VLVVEKEVEEERREGQAGQQQAGRRVTHHCLDCLRQARFCGTGGTEVDVCLGGQGSSRSMQLLWLVLPRLRTSELNLHSRCHVCASGHMDNPDVLPTCCMVWVPDHLLSGPSPATYTPSPS
jgi:hypothetical protein